jgi:hypothetical protein
MGFNIGPVNVPREWPPGVLCRGPREVECRVVLSDRTVLRPLNVTLPTHPGERQGLAAHSSA